MSKFCYNCGEKVDDNIYTCPECGHEFEKPVNQPDEPLVYYSPQEQYQYYYGTDADTVADSLKWTTPAGRLNRMRYFTRLMILSICSLLVIEFSPHVLSLLGLTPTAIQFAAENICPLPFLILGFINAIKRLHDLNKSGIWLILAFIPIVNLGFSIYLLFFKGTSGPNQYGSDPLTF